MAKTGNQALRLFMIRPLGSLLPLQCIGRGEFPEVKNSYLGAEGAAFADEEKVAIMVLPVIRCRSTQLLTVQELVALGHGVSLVPAMARQMDRGRRCQYRSLAAPKPTRTLRMIWHKTRYQSPLVK
jgi:DNA-binding transcriptional LysR family regulator